MGRVNRHAPPTATRALRMASSSEVLPWSTWPMTVTTGGRDSIASSFAADCTRNDSGSSSFAGFAWCPISETTIIAVSWSITWLMVTIEPIFIMVLMTSAAFTDILWARSPTEIVSGTSTSITLGSAGAANDVAPSSSRWRAPRERHPSRPPEASPPVLIVRRLATSSTPPEAGPAALRALGLRLALARLDFVDDRGHGRGGLDRLGRRLDLVDLHEGALLANLDLDGSRLAGGVGLLDLGRLLARERDLLLLFLVAVHLAQVVEEARLVLLGDRVLARFLLHASGLKLLEQQGDRELELLGKLGDVRLGHSFPFLAFRPAPAAP